MQCGLLKLRRVLRERARPESRAGSGPAGPARIRCERGAAAHPSGELPSGSKPEREFAGWSVVVDNFS